MSNANASVTLKLIDKLSAPLKKVQGSLGRLQALGKKLGSGLAATGKGTAQFVAKQLRLKRSVDQTTHAMERQAQKARGLGASLRGFAAGAAMAFGGASMAGAMGAPLEVASNFEAAMDKVAAVARLSEGSAELESLRAQALELGNSSAFSATDVAGGQDFLAMAGFNPDAILQAMPHMLDLAKATGTELADTADITSNIMTGFGLDPKETERMADVLVATTTRSNVNLGMLGETMKYVAPKAKELGVSFEQAAAMAGVFGNAGIQASQAGTALRGILTQLSAPTSQGKKAMKALGLSVQDAAGNMRPITDILADIAMKTRDLGSIERAQIFKDLIGVEAGSAFSALIDKQGLESFIGLLGELNQAQGEAARVAKDMADNLSGDKVALGSAVEGFQIALGTQLIPLMRQATQHITAMVRGISEFVNQHPRLAQFAAVFTTLMGAVLAAVGTLSFLGPAIAALVSPIGLVVATMVAAASYIITHWDAFKTQFEAVWQAVQNVATQAVAVIKALFAGDWAGASEAASRLLQAFSGLGAAIAGLFSQLGSMIKADLEAALSLDLDPYLAPIKAAFESLKAFMSQVFSGVAQHWQPIKQSLAELGQSFAGLFETLGRLGSKLGEVFGGEQSSGFAKFLGSVAGGALETFVDMMTVAATAAEGLLRGIEGVINLFQGGSFADAFEGFDWQGLIPDMSWLNDWFSGNERSAEALNAHKAALQGLAAATPEAIENLKKLSGVEVNKKAYEATQGLTEVEAQIKALYRALTKQTGEGLFGEWKEGTGLVKSLKDGSLSLESYQDRLNEVIAGGGRYANNAENMLKASFDLAEAMSAKTMFEQTLSNIEAVKSEAQGAASAVSAVAADLKPDVASSLPTPNAGPAIDPVAMNQALAAAQQLDAQAGQITAKMAAMKQAVLSAVQQAESTLASANWATHGARLIDTLVQGVQSRAGALAAAVRSEVAKARALMPSSNAKEGPFSRLTHYGGSILETMGQGVRAGGAQPLAAPLAAAMAASLATGPVQAAPNLLTAPGAQPTAFAPQPQGQTQATSARGGSGANVTVNVTINDARDPEAVLGQLEARVAEAIRRAMNDGGGL